MDFRYLETPIGTLLLAGDQHGLRRISFTTGQHPARPDPGWHYEPRTFDAAETQLTEYFAGRRQRFELQYLPEGTPFQRQVWQALIEIPYGETTSYAQIAARIGRATATRAVGLANGSNPLPIVIPCHRVIGASGKLTGYGGGLAIKERLLALERGAQRLVD